MGEPFRPTPLEFEILARYRAEERLHLTAKRMETGNMDDDPFIHEATERLLEIAEEMGEDEVDRIVGEVEQEFRQAVGDDCWQRLQETTPTHWSAISAVKDQPNRIRESNKAVAGVTMHHVITGEGTKGWIHTHGMEAHDLPELEVRDVPTYFAGAAARLLRGLCQYMMTPGVTVKLGETIQVSPVAVVTLVKSEPIPGSEEHYDVERWQIIEGHSACQSCGQVHGDEAAEE